MSDYDLARPTEARQNDPNPHTPDNPGCVLLCGQKMKFRMTVMALTLSAAGLTGIAVHENYRSKAYNDGVGVQTLGFGSTTHESGRPLQPSDTTTPPRALVKMNNDLDRMQRAMRACLGDVPLYQHEWDAYVSLTYNIGEGAFCRSSLIKNLKKTPPDYAGACTEILRWDKAGGKVLRGLTKRREAEYALCVGDVKP